MSNTNAVSMGGSGNQLAQNLTSLAHSVNIPRGLAAMLLAYRLQRYGTSLFPIGSIRTSPCPVLSLNIPYLSTKASTKPLNNSTSSFSTSHRRRRTPPRAQSLDACESKAIYCHLRRHHGLHSRLRHTRHPRCNWLFRYRSRIGEYCCGMASKYRIRYCRQFLCLSTKCCYGRGCNGAI